MAGNPGGTRWTDLVLQFHDHFFRYPGVTFFVCMTILFAWAAGAGNGMTSVRFWWLSLTSFLLTAVSYLLYRWHAWYRRRKASEPIEREFKFDEFRGGDWSEVLDLRGGDSFARCDMRVWNEHSGHFERNVTYYTGFLDLVQDRYRKGEVSTPMTLRLTTWVTQPKRVVEQATFTFYLDTKPHRVRVSIGSDMPHKERRALMNRIAASILDVASGRRVSYLETPRAGTAEADVTD